VSVSEITPLTRAPALPPSCALGAGPGWRGPCSYCSPSTRRGRRSAGERARACCVFENGVCHRHYCARINLLTHTHTHDLMHSRTRTRTHTHAHTHTHTLSTLTLSKEVIVTVAEVSSQSPPLDLSFFQLELSFDCVVARMPLHGLGTARVSVPLPAGAARGEYTLRVVTHSPGLLLLPAEVRVSVDPAARPAGSWPLPPGVAGLVLGAALATAFAAALRSTRVHTAPPGAAAASARSPKKDN
jgi:hypothetical protein